MSWWWRRTIRLPPKILVSHRARQCVRRPAGHLSSGIRTLFSGRVTSKYQPRNGTMNRIPRGTHTIPVNSYSPINLYLPINGPQGYCLLTTHVFVNKEEAIRELELFISTKQDEKASVKEMCAIFIERLCRSGNLSDASYLLRYLHAARGIHLDLKVHNLLLASACEEANFDLFCEIFKSLLFSGIPPDLSSYTSIAKVFEKVVDMDLVIKFAIEVSEITRLFDPTVINRIIYVTAESGQIDKSLKIYEELKSRDCKMDKVTFNTVLSILGKTGKVNEMLYEFELMKDLGHAPDIVTYTTLINCLRRMGRLDLCKAFSKKMVEEGVEMDLLTYTALIDAYGRAGHVDDALKLFAEMKKTHLPSVYVYRALVSVLKKAGKLDLALNLSVEMNSGTIKLAGPEDFKEKHKGRRKI